MVTQQAESTSTDAVAEPLPETTDDLIEDSTPPERLAMEAAWERGEDIDAAVEVDEAAAPEPEAEAAEEPAAQVAEPEPEKPVEPEPAPEIPPRSYTQDEWGKRESAYRRLQAEAENRLRALAERESARDLETEVGARVRVLQQQLEPTLGTEEAARVAQSRTDEIRGGLTAQFGLWQAQQQLQQSQTRQVGTILSSWAGELQRQHNLNAEDTQLLMGVVNPLAIPDEGTFMQVGQSMEQMARRLAQASATVRQTEEQKQARVPPATPEQTPETGESTSAPDSEQALVNRLVNTPGHLWSKEESALMRRRAGR